MWGFVDKTGKEIVPLKYQSADNFSEGMATVQLNDKWVLSIGPVKRLYHQNMMMPVI